MSLEGVSISAEEVEYCSHWVINNIQKFSKLMGVSLKGMKNLSYLFFAEIEKWKVSKKKNDLVLKKRKKLNVGTPRELKRLETSINYDGRKKESKAVSGFKMICQC